MGWSQAEQAVIALEADKKLAESGTSGIERLFATEAVTHGRTNGRGRLAQGRGRERTGTVRDRLRLGRRLHKLARGIAGAWHPR